MQYTEQTVGEATESSEGACSLSYIHTSTCRYTQIHSRSVQGEFREGKEVPWVVDPCIAYCVLVMDR